MCWGPCTCPEDHYFLHIMPSNLPPSPCTIFLPIVNAYRVIPGICFRFLCHVYRMYDRHDYDFYLCPHEYTLMSRCNFRLPPIVFGPRLADICPFIGTSYHRPVIKDLINGSFFARPYHVYHIIFIKKPLHLTSLGCGNPIAKLIGRWLTNSSPSDRIDSKVSWVCLGTDFLVRWEDQSIREMSVCLRTMKIRGAIIIDPQHRRDAYSHTKPAEDSSHPQWYPRKSPQPSARSCQKATVWRGGSRYTSQSTHPCGVQGVSEETSMAQDRELDHIIIQAEL